MFVLPDKAAMYRSLLGSVLSIFTVVALLSFSLYKFVKLEGQTEVIVNQSSHEDYYDSSFTFSSKGDGFQVAAAVTSFDANPEPIEDPEIG